MTHLSSSRMCNKEKTGEDKSLGDKKKGPWDLCAAAVLYLLYETTDHA